VSQENVAMASYAAFLRAVNLGSNRKASGTDLRAVFEGLGFKDVDTFRNSGNVVFDAGRESAAKLTKRIEAGLEEGLGFEVVTFLRTANDVLAIAADEPFAPKLVEASKGKVQVWILPEKPPQGARKQVLALGTDADRLAFGTRELYWLPSGGTQKSELDQAAIAKLLGPTTMRTKGTIEQLAAKYFAG
jgi:uncharacterized protein (DUF1697 family)